MLTIACTDLIAKTLAVLVAVHAIRFAKQIAFDQMIVQQTQIVQQSEKCLIDTNKQIENEKTELKFKQDDLQLYKKLKEHDVEILELND
ncbi:MAG: hypothetical protein EZS28_014286 [Streblomastix strix]|uniref:Uncharacterized protein n=1 Tax=Streblomastix strix TaxID=222440 RepID=A0A5J4W5M5_9EUKA|nr:MAG: hypothetical protein EZS28_014286 [Streblomastix strix]